MDIDKTKRTLRKIQALTDTLEDQGSISALERDLLLSYVRDLYELVHAASVTSSPGRTTPVPPKPVEKAPEVKPFDAPVRQEPRQETPVEDAPSRPQPTPITNGKTGEQEHGTTEKHYEVEPPLPEPVEVEHSASDARMESAGKFQPLFETKSSEDLVGKLQTQAVTSIQSALGINERLLTINELFDGDSRAFEETVSQLNGLSDFESARRYLIQGPASKYSWDDESKLAKARAFIQIVRRKYL